MHPVRRGDIYYADLSPVVGSEQGGMRPVLIIQNDTGNRHSPTVIAAAITSQTGKANLPTHISLAARSCGLTRDSVILLEQVRTLDKSRLRERMGRVDGELMERIDAAIAVSFGCYIPVVLFSKAVPAVGALMLPKTAAYVWMVWMGFGELKSVLKEKGVLQ